MPSLRQLRDHLQGIDRETLAAHLQDYNYPRSSLGMSENPTDLGIAPLGIYLKVIEHDTQGALDDYHRGLLSSDVDVDLLVGALSVLYWGFLAHGQDFARSKVQKSIDRVTGNRILDGTIEALRDGVSFSEELDFYTAVERFHTFHGIGFSFATKLCAFSNPGNAGVLDSVINDHYAIGLNMNSRSRVNRMTYQCYCELLTEKALQLGCRAVDIERSLYAVARQP